MPLALQDLQDGLDQEAPQADQQDQQDHKERPVMWQDRLDQLAQVVIH